MICINTYKKPILVDCFFQILRLLDLFQKDPAILDHFQMRFDIERDRRGVTSFRRP